MTSPRAHNAKVDPRERKARLAAWHVRIRAGEGSAVEELRAYLTSGAWSKTSDAAELRFLLRVASDAGLVGEGSAHELIAEALRALKKVWPKKPKRDLFALCDAVEAASESRDLARGFDDEEREQPAKQAARRTVCLLAEGANLALVLRRTTNTVAGLCATATDDATKAKARAVAYTRVLERLASALQEAALTSKSRSHALLELLVSAGYVTPAYAAANAELAQKALEQELAAVVALPASARPEALEDALLASDAIDDLFATRADLARLLAAWG